MSINKIKIITSLCVVLIQAACLYSVFDSENTFGRYSISIISMLLGKSIYTLYKDIKHVVTIKIICNE